MARSLAGVLVLTTLLVGCSSETETAPPPLPLDEGLPAPAAGKGLQLQVRSAVPPGAESHFCREFVLPTDAEVEVAKIEHAYPSGSHHIIVYRTDRPAEDVTDEIFACGDIPGQMIYNAEFQEHPVFPPGVGVKLAAREVLRIETHFLNTSDSTADADVRLNLHYSEAPLAEEAGSFLLYDFNIAIPPMSTFTSRMHCVIPSDIEIPYLAPHFHMSGKAFRSWISGGDLAEPVPLVMAEGYANLHTQVFPEPLKIKAGQAIDIECDYQNTTGEWLVEGPSANENEMCVLLGSYYPRLDIATEWCANVGSGTVRDGSKTCGEAFACFIAEPDDIGQEQCRMDTCAASSQLLNEFFNCSFSHCRDVCPLEPKKCQACAIQNCGSELVACQDGTCDAD